MLLWIQCHQLTICLKRLDHLAGFRKEHLLQYIQFHYAAMVLQLYAAYLLFIHHHTDATFRLLMIIIILLM